ncbi:hypothetical protein [Arthrobacter cryoconiti]|uniref:Uncharacterized protein n=2 Tax=Arthrobacter cryoconiti TaxID=748907 RepID=A0ABV8R469_9MICC|nr:hypothetical protein [Arthrobacter cryoconiti]
MTLTASPFHHFRQAANHHEPALTEEFTVLLSHWSDSLNWHPPRFNQASLAHDWAASIVLAQPGITYVLLYRLHGNKSWIGEDGRSVAEHPYHFLTGRWPADRAADLHEMGAP